MLNIDAYMYQNMAQMHPSWTTMYEIVYLCTCCRYQIDERWNQWSLAHNRQQHEYSDRQSRYESRLDECEQRLKTSVPSREETQRAIESIELRQRSLEQTLRQEMLAQNQSQV
jgi:hypothetical protein